MGYLGKIVIVTYKCLKWVLNMGTQEKSQEISLGPVCVSQKRVFSPHKCGLVQSGMTEDTEPELGQTNSSGARCRNSLPCSVCHTVHRPLGVRSCSCLLAVPQCDLPSTQGIASKGPEKENSSGRREETPVNPNPFA